MNSTCNLDTLIYKHFRTRGNMANALGVHRTTVQRWLTSDPRKMLMYTPELVEMGVDQLELTECVKERDARLQGTL